MCLTMQRRANRGDMSEPCGLFLWWRGRRSGPSLEQWGGVAVTSDPVRRGSPGTTSEWVRRWSCRPFETLLSGGRDVRVYVGVTRCPFPLTQPKSSPFIA